MHGELHRIILAALARSIYRRRETRSCHNPGLSFMRLSSFHRYRRRGQRCFVIGREVISDIFETGFDGRPVNRKALAVVAQPGLFK
jgi:hypothetical protein